jgi:hypothetical protein
MKFVGERGFMIEWTHSQKKTKAMTDRSEIRA